MKSFLFYVALVGLLWWLSSCLQLLQNVTSTTNCPLLQRHLDQEWKTRQQPQPHQSIELQKSASFPSPSSRNIKRRLRVLMGIFTFDSVSQQPYRRQFRKLFDVFPKYNDTRVCSLDDFEAMSEDVRYDCQWIYTFVVGGLKEDNATARTEWIDDAWGPIALPMSPDNILSGDLKENSDVTYLNIQENMNEGKSQTWFKYATRIMDKYDLDYVGKMDSDSLPYLDKFFSYAYSNLPPPPYNNGILVGVPIDKLWWQRTKAEIVQDTNEDFFKEAYGKVMHLYAAGQCYMMSKDLAKVVVTESPNSVAYREGPEDHDISAMAFHSTKPISFHFLTLQQQFWRHPVKRYDKRIRQWKTLWHNENVRIKKVLELQHSYYNKDEPLTDLAIPSGLTAPVQQQLDDSMAEEDGKNIYSDLADKEKI